MISQFSKELSEVLAFSREEADRLSCPSVAPEHLLLAVFRLSDPKIQRVISTLSLDVPTVKKELEQYASSNKEESKRIYEEINVTDRAANVLHLAVLEDPGHSPRPDRHGREDDAAGSPPRLH